MAHLLVCRTRNLVVLLLLVIVVCLPHLEAQSPSTLDAILQDYAYRAFVNPRTGIVYDGTVPSNLTGIKTSAIRLRSGSLRSRGVNAFKEFQIPVGVVVQPYVVRLVLVYHNLGNWSNVYYPLDGYTYLTPMVGLLAYDAVNLTATNLPVLDIRATRNPMLIRFSNVEAVPYGSVPKCVSFDQRGIVNFSNVVSGYTCSTLQQGHFALVVEGTAPSPSPSPSPSSPKKTPPTSHKKKDMKKIWIIVGSVVGGVLLLALMVLLLVWLKKYQHKKKMQHMERASEVGEALRMTSIGSAKAPAAMVTRTQPTLETEYAP